MAIGALWCAEITPASLGPRVENELKLIAGRLTSPVSLRLKTGSKIRENSLIWPWTRDRVATRRSGLTARRNLTEESAEFSASNGTSIYFSALATFALHFHPIGKNQNIEKERKIDSKNKIPRTITSRKHSMELNNWIQIDLGCFFQLAFLFSRKISLGKAANG